MFLPRVPAPVFCYGFFLLSGRGRLLFCGGGGGCGFGETTFPGSFGGRLSLPGFPWPKAPAVIAPTITSTINFRINFFISC